MRGKGTSVHRTGAKNARPGLASRSHPRASIQVCETAINSQSDWRGGQRNRRRWELLQQQCSSAVPESAAQHSMSPSPWRHLLQPFTPAVLDPPPPSFRSRPARSRSNQSTVVTGQKLQLFGLTRPVVSVQPQHRLRTSGSNRPVQVRTQDTNGFCRSVRYSYYVHLFCLLYIEFFFG